MLLREYVEDDAEAFFRLNSDPEVLRYSNFSADYNALGVKPVDDKVQNPYLNSDHAGTPENFKSFVIGGATGGGGGNFTGGLSATKSVGPCRP